MKKRIILLPLVLCSVLFVSYGSVKLNEKKTTKVLKAYLEKSGDMKFQKTGPFFVRGGTTQRFITHMNQHLA